MMILKGDYYEVARLIEWVIVMLIFMGAVKALIGVLI